jgi:hypothetical protein
MDLGDPEGAEVGDQLCLDPGAMLFGVCAAEHEVELQDVAFHASAPHHLCEPHALSGDRVAHARRGGFEQGGGVDLAHGAAPLCRKCASVSRTRKAYTQRVVS